jgi:hypothetical protein
MPFLSGEVRAEPQSDRILGLVRSQEVGPERKDVGVIVLPGKGQDMLRAAIEHGAADMMEAVGAHSLALAGPAEDDAFGIALATDSPGHNRNIIGIIVIMDVGMRSAVIHMMPERRQELDEFPFHFESGVI